MSGKKRSQGFNFEKDVDERDIDSPFRDNYGTFLTLIPFSRKLGTMKSKVPGVYTFIRILSGQQKTSKFC